MTNCIMLISNGCQLFFSQFVRKYWYLIAIIYRAFRVMDDNNSGDLTFEEFINGVRDMGMNLTDDEITEMFRQFDTDGSGSIKYDEFLKAVRVCLLHYSISE